MKGCDWGEAVAKKLSPRADDEPRLWDDTGQTKRHRPTQRHRHPGYGPLLLGASHPRFPAFLLSSTVSHLLSSSLLLLGRDQTTETNMTRTPSSSPRRTTANRSLRSAVRFKPESGFEVFRLFCFFEVCQFFGSVQRVYVLRCCLGPSELFWCFRGFRVVWLFASEFDVFGFFMVVVGCEFASWCSHPSSAQRSCSCCASYSSMLPLTAPEFFCVQQ